MVKIAYGSGDLLQIFTLRWSHKWTQNSNNVDIDLGRLASRLFTEVALGGIIFSQMLTPTGERHKDFQTEDL